MAHRREPVPVPPLVLVTVTTGPTPKWGSSGATGAVAGGASAQAPSATSAVSAESAESLIASGRRRSCVVYEDMGDFSRLVTSGGVIPSAVEESQSSR